MVVDKNELHDFNKHSGATFKKFDLNLTMCSSYCLSLFSVVNQFSVVNILAEYNNPTQRRITKVSSSRKAIDSNGCLVGYESPTCPTSDLLSRRLYGILVNRVEHSRYHH
jgi:hypothetical protein